MVDAINPVKQPEQQKTGPTVKGSMTATVAGAGVGYGAVHLLNRGWTAEVKSTLATTKDAFVKKAQTEALAGAEASAKRLNIPVDVIKNQIESMKSSYESAYETVQTQGKEFLKTLTKTKLKHAAGGAAVALLTYLGVKAFLGRNKEKA